MPTLLQHLRWPQAQSLLRADPIVVLPLGAALKQHGHHLPLDTDLQLAEWFGRALLDWPDAPEPVLVAPPIAFSFYPAFVRYPGSTSLELATARDSIIDIVRSLAHHGARRFYILNTGLSTERAIAPAATTAAASGWLLQWADIRTIAETTELALTDQAEGSHADELETSMLLHINPACVRMDLAQPDFAPGSGPFSPKREPGTRYSPTGVYGDPTLASAEKGAKIVAAWRHGIERDLLIMRTARLPTPAQSPT